MPPGPTLSYRRRLAAPQVVLKGLAEPGGNDGHVDLACGGTKRDKEVREVGDGFARLTNKSGRI